MVRSFPVIQASGSVLDPASCPCIPSLQQLIEITNRSKLSSPQVAVVGHFVTEMGNTMKNSGFWLFLDFHSFESVLLYFLIEKLKSFHKIFTSSNLKSELRTLVNIIALPVASGAISSLVSYFS